MRFFLLNLDGSDRFTKYWYDVRKIKPYLAFREIRLNFLDAILSMVMLWRKFAAGGTVPIVVIYKDKAVFFLVIWPQLFTVPILIIIF